MRRYARFASYFRGSMWADEHTRFVISSVPGICITSLIPQRDEPEFFNSMMGLPHQFIRQAESRMKRQAQSFGRRLVAGLLLIVPVYLASLLLLKAMKTLAGLVRPFARLLPDWLPAEQLLSLVLVVVFCYLIGSAIETPRGRAARERIEKSLFERIPGYALIRSLTHRMAGESQDNAWKPALAEIEEALVPAFIIEELKDGSFTVFVPSVPTPLAGAIYILSADRVHPLDVPFTHAIRTISRWGSGSGELVAAMRATEMARDKTMSKSTTNGSGQDRSHEKGNN